MYNWGIYENPTPARVVSGAWRPCTSTDATKLRVEYESQITEKPRDQKLARAIQILIGWESCI